MPCLVDLRPDTVVDLTVLRPFLPSADALDKPDDNLEPKPEDDRLIFSVREGRRDVVYSEEEGAGGFLRLLRLEEVECDFELEEVG